MSRQTSTRFSFLLNLASSASLPGGTFSYTTDMVSPSIVEQNNYLPFGSRLPLTDPAYDFGNRWRYAAKEEQRFGPADLGLLDFGARMYDPFTARWPSPDPMAAKYPGHSPFNYCEGSPINRIDPQGDTIVVLYARSGAYGFGHMAILVQDEHGKYYLWSKNGNKLGGDSHKDNKGDPIDDIQSFLDGINNAPGHSITDDKPYYTEGYMIATTPEQDAIIKETMEKEIDNDYNFFFSNCGQAVKNSLEAADVPSSTTLLNSLPLIYTTLNPDKAAIGALEHSFNKAVPARIYFNIKRANPKGKIFRPTK